MMPFVYETCVVSRGAFLKVHSHSNTSSIAKIQRNLVDYQIANTTSNTVLICLQDVKRKLYKQRRKSTGGGYSDEEKELQQFQIVITSK